MATGNFSEAPISPGTPKISVLLPSYNNARFLPEAITSVLGQDFTAFEMVISDDASTDNSAEIIKRFAQHDTRLHMTVQPRNLGLVSNFNWCLSQARGEYIKFIAGDDKLARSDALGRLAALLDENPRVTLASSAARIINERSEVEFVRDYLRRDRLEEGTIACRRCLMSGVNQIGEPSLVLFRRRFAGSGFNPTYRHWVDVEFALRVLEQGWFAYLAEPLVSFRFHEGQQTRRDQAENLHLTEFYRLLLDCADRPWLGHKAARERLFEELYQSRRRPEFDVEARRSLNRALDHLGRHGYAGFMFRRKLLRPLQNLRGSMTKRIRPPPVLTAAN